MKFLLNSVFKTLPLNNSIPKIATEPKIMVIMLSKLKVVTLKINKQAEIIVKIIVIMKMLKHPCDILMLATK